MVASVMRTGQRTVRPTRHLTGGSGRAFLVTIERIHVEGGFLHGLDLRLKRGLNVLIGARGTGKTSVIELIRYAFGIKNQTSEGVEQSLRHARATLADGEVTLKIDDVLDVVTLSRTATEDAPRSNGFITYRSPIVFSQKEIENVALSEQGRLNLIDGFIANRSELSKRETTLKEEIRAIEQAISPLRIDIVRLTDELTHRTQIAEEIESLKAQQETFRARAEIDVTKQERVQSFARALTGLSQRQDARSELIARIDIWLDTLPRFQRFDDPAPESVAADQTLSVLTDRLNAAMGMMSSAVEELLQVKVAAETELAQLGRHRVTVENAFREARQEIDIAMQGAGAVEKNLQVLQHQLSRLDTQARSISERGTRLAELRERRESTLEQLESVRNERYQSRQAIAERLNDALSPRIKVTIHRSARYDQYAKALIEALRGTGLKYNDIATTLASTVSPRELVRYVETGDYDALASATELPRDRCSRIINALADAGVGEILVSVVEDRVRLRLLDGTEYKEINELSAGQRCTVILPIVFQHADRVLVIDQPEDHIDNAFIVDTLIKSLRARASDSQIILATHNANIPVLGNADWVVQMVSDGRHGSVAVAAPLDDIESVSAITNVMEGGIQAFHDRANFYDDHVL